jgi:lipopolysaccharide/colanic/teichoic acid biosynthesis glycosyltransferase
MRSHNKDAKRASGTIVVPDAPFARRRIDFAAFGRSIVECGPTSGIIHRDRGEEEGAPPRRPQIALPDMNPPGYSARHVTFVLAALALTLDLLVVFAIAPPAAAGASLAAAVPAILLFGHAEPRRGRRSSTLVTAAICASSLIVLILLCSRGSSGLSPALLAASVLAPWPGHLLAIWRGTPHVTHGPPLVHDRMARIVKRAIDLVFAFLAAALAVPVVLISAIVVRITTPGPAFYAQTRVTRGDAPFLIWKIRTMTQDAESGTPVWPEDNDPRITKAGRFLRRVWIDELPQIWNVLRGEMSLVGPRPERPEFVEAFAAALPKYRKRHAISAGITGLAQVVGLIGDTSIRRRLALDLHYVRIWTPGLDAWILGHTVLQAILRALGRPPLGKRRARRPKSGLGGSILEIRGVARHLPERDQ